MNKVNYKKIIGNDGFVYNQTIKVDFEDMEKILKAIVFEKENRYPNHKEYCCNGVHYANMFLLHPSECEKEYLKDGVIYYTTLTTTKLIKNVLKNDRILLDRNTILYYVYKGVK